MKMVKTFHPIALSLAALLLIVDSLIPAAVAAVTERHEAESQSRPPTLRLDAGDEGEDGGPERSIEYFNQWIGEPLGPERLHRMWDEVLATPSEAPPGAEDFVTSWELIGPLYSVNPGSGYMTGRVRDIEASTTRVLAASGGLWRFNFGPIPMSERIPATWFGSFSSNPNDPSTILVGTGEYVIGSGTGLYKSVDGGATWAHAYMSPEPAQFHKVRWSPTGAVAYAATTSGFYRSIDGLQWTRTLTGNVTDLSTVGGGFFPNTVYAPVYNDGLYRSTDAGATWSKMTTGGIPITGTAEGAVSSLPHSFFPGWIYVSFVNAGVWRSTDDGDSWTNITPASDPHRFWYANVIAASPWEPNYVLLGGVGARLSSDGGVTWTSLVTPNLHADYHSFSWNSDGVGVWAGNDGGWFHSSDHGRTWDSSSNVMPITQFYSIDCEKTEIGYMIGGTQDNDLVFTPTQDLFWSDKGEGDGAGVSVDLYTLGRMWGIHGDFGGSMPYHRERTTNGGANWQEVDNGIDPNTTTGVIRGDNAFNPWLITSAGPNVYDSSDGINWTKSNATPFPANVSNLTSSTRVSPNSVAYACMGSVVSGQSLFVRDGGVWVNRSAGLPAGRTIRKVVPHPWSGNYADEAWALMNGINNPGQKVFHTTNRGITWTNVSGNLPDVPMGDLVVNPHDTNLLFVGTFLGCYRSTDGGANWERWNNGLTPAVMVTEMAYIDLTPSDGPFYVVAATHGRSVWRRVGLGTDPAAVGSLAGSRLRLDMSTPNPVSRKATMRFFLAQGGPARMEVYDVRGEHVSTALDATLPGGFHQITLDGRTLAPGVFFYRLVSGGRTAVQKITVVR